MDILKALTEKKKLGEFRIFKVRAYITREIDISSKLDPYLIIKYGD